MFLPIRTDSPLRSTPYMNWALIAANLVGLILQTAKPELTQRYELYAHDPQLLRFVTYAFLHAGLWHLAGNMLFLFIFGNNVNDRMGHIGYLCFYLAGAIFAGIGYVVTQPASVGVVGASGAVAAVTGAYLVLFPRANITIFYMIFFIGSLELPSFWVILFFFAKDLFYSVGADTMVAHNAHISGTLFGFTITFLLLIVHLLPRDTFDVLALFQRWNKRRQYRDMVSKGYNPFAFGADGRGGEAASGQPAAADPAIRRASELRAEISEAIAQHRLENVSALYEELKALDPNQVLPKQTQLDVANHLAAEQRYAQAAEAYESFLRNYPKHEQVEQVELMLGLVYARYLNQYDRAKHLLTRAAERLHGDREKSLARSELDRIGPLAAAAPQ